MQKGKTTCKSRKQRKRWGKKFVDKRDWVKYNEELVVRGEFLMELDWVKSWDYELDQMNEDKVGAKYMYPNSLIEIQSVWHQWISYREIEGLTRKLVKIAKLRAFNDYTTINRRVNRVKVSFKLPQNGSCSVACDGTGMRFENAGQYRARMYGKKRKKYIKATITADPLTGELLAITTSIEGEGFSEPEVAERDIEYLIAHGTIVHKFWGDGSFDTIDLFALMERHMIESAVKLRKTSVVKGDGSMRDKEVLLYKKKGYRKWAKEKEYGKRWVGTEGIFSAVKRKFGEETRSKKLVNALDEVERKFWIYERMRQYAKTQA